MRGLCALIVVIGHAPFALNIPEFLPHSWLSVDMFFVLSGFVIALTYEPRLWDGMNITAFMAARAKRLLPVQIIGTLICALCIAPIYWHEVPGWLLAVTTFLTMFVIPISWLRIPNIPANLASEFVINPPLWSLLGEWIVNGLYGLFLNKWSSRLLLVPIVFAATHLVYRVLISHGPVVGQLGGDRAIIGFTLGVLIYRAYQARRLQGLPKLRPVLVYGMWFVATCMPLIGKYPLLDALPGVALSGSLIILLVRNERPMGKTWAYLGAISYPLYASHFAIINLLGWLWPRAEPRPALLIVPLVITQIGLATVLSRVRIPVRKRSNAVIPDTDGQPFPINPPV